MIEWNLRYVAYATLHGRTPETMLLYDKRMWPGGSMCGYVTWIQERWTKWDALRRHPKDHVRTEQEHAEFTAWLFEQVKKGVAT